MNIWSQAYKMWYGNGLCPYVQIVHEVKKKVKGKVDP
jgi:hypothetical protein